ncbi:MAG TPA: MASE3 domain-containing protein [Dehalococcoidales bacterium]|nr:MASE3 domain-containing protein [Dehalococcoidales bacterium]
MRSPPSFTLSLKTWRNIREWVIFAACLAGIGLSSIYSYLFFHTAAELFAITIAVATFFIAWNARRYMDNPYLLFIGIGFLFISIIESLHMMTFKGMGIFNWDEPTNLPTQLWIAARFMESLTFLLAFSIVKANLKTGWVFGFFALATALLLLSIFVWRIFPTCYIEGVGLSTFKTVSEYVISGIFAVSIYLLYRRRTEFDRRIYTYLVISLVFMIGTGIAFSQYVNVYGGANLTGHLFMLVSFYMLYKAVIETGLNQPYSLLFRNLKLSENNLEQRAAQLSEINANLVREKSERELIEKELEEHRKNLEDLVRRRTSELLQSNRQLAIEINERARIEDELRTLSKRTIEALEEERQFISRELHDETGQSLTVLNLLLTNLKRALAQGKKMELSQIDEPLEIVQEVMGQVRALSTNLHPSMLDNIGLVPTLTWYIAEFSKRTGIKINFDYFGSETSLSPRVRLTAYRIIQESLTNITRYAGVNEAFVQLSFNSDSLQIYIEDEGRGFDLDNISTTSSGLRGMRERASTLGGSFHISSFPGEGTRLEVVLPFNPGAS